MEKRHLWSPWRMQYVQQDAGKKLEQHCFLCDAVSGDDPLVVWHDTHVFAILNRYPYNSGHIMLAPRAHLGDYAALADDTAVALERATRRFTRILQENFACHGLNIGMNIGKAAGAGLPDHLHVHLVPRWLGDTNFMPVIADTVVMPETLVDTANRIKSALTKEANMNLRG